MKFDYEHETKTLLKANSIIIEKYLNGLSFPATKADLIKCASQNNAPEEIIEMLDELEETTFNSFADISQEMNEIVE